MGATTFPCSSTSSSIVSICWTEARLFSTPASNWARVEFRLLCNCRTCTWALSRESSSWLREKRDWSIWAREDSRDARVWVSWAFNWLICKSDCSRPRRALSAAIFAWSTPIWLWATPVFAASTFIFAWSAAMRA